MRKRLAIHLITALCGTQAMFGCTSLTLESSSNVQAALDAQYHAEAQTPPATTKESDAILESYYGRVGTFITANE